MKKVLILSHQGMGFVSKQVNAAKKIGLDFIILTSGELENKVKEDWDTNGWSYIVTQNTELTQADIKEHIDDFDCCITVWDAYRSLMAFANQLINAHDVTEQQVQLMQDKYALRKLLNEHGLSKVQCYLASDVHDHLVDFDNTEFFIKPRRGAGSFFASKISSREDFESILSDFASRNVDGEASAFKSFVSGNQLYIEEFIEGTEFSFEIILENGRRKYCVEHEKIMGIDKKTNVALEEAFISPCYSLEKKEIDAALLKIDNILSLLDVTTGCYHIELRYTPHNEWELIEVNPRLGGACIDESIQHRINKNYLEEQLKHLINQNEVGEMQIDAQATYFEVSFAQPGCSIKSFEKNKIYPSPQIDMMFYKEGETTENSKAEIFAGMHLWAIDLCEQQDFMNNIHNQRYLMVNYN